jgi:glucokinase
MLSYAIGVDLGGTNLRIAAVDESGKLLEKLSSGTDLAHGRDAVIDEMTQAIHRLLDSFRGRGVSRGVGIGVPGIIDMDTGMLRESPNLPGWSEFPVHAEIERRLGIPVVLENDANAAALGEKWLGAARDHQNMCMLTLGTGVGGGIVLNGKIWHGMNGMAGELGHINVEPEGHPCKCGSRGCLEQYASATAVVRMAREAVANNLSRELARAAEGEEFNSLHVYQLAKQGDTAAQDIFRRVGCALGLVLADMVNGLNLPIYVIGGGAASAWDAFAPAMMEEVRKRSFVYAATVPEVPQAAKPKKNILTTKPGKSTLITMAQLGSEAGLYGAAYLPLQRAGIK